MDGGHGCEVRGEEVAEEELKRNKKKLEGNRDQGLFDDIFAII